MAILVTTFGASWQIVPELYGFTNPDHLPLYKSSSDRNAITSMRKRFKIPAVKEIWLVTTEGTEDQRQLLRRWAEQWDDSLRLRAWWPQGITDLRSETDVTQMAELIHRVVALAHSQHRDEMVVLSLAGGRKTMSADLQRAGQAFGYSSLIHVIDRLDPAKRKFLRESDVTLFHTSLPPEMCDAFLPLVVAGKMPGSDAVASECAGEIAQRVTTLLEGGSVNCNDCGLVQQIENVMRSADSLRANYATILSRDQAAGNFRALYTLPRFTVNKLQQGMVGQQTAQQDRDIKWLRTLPKVELHCHLGGVLSVAEMILVATTEDEDITIARRSDACFDRDLSQLDRLVREESLSGLRQWLGSCEDKTDFKSLRQRWQVREPLGVCAFLLAFSNKQKLLDELIYGELRNPSFFHRVGIERYELLGDLQGSGLLQSAKTLRKTVHLLAEKCCAEHVFYLELRCSPLNYTRGNLQEMQVVKELLDAIEQTAGVDIRLIFIASRHRNAEQIKKHIELTADLLASDERFSRRFVGFDLAGNEHAATPSLFRDMFRPLHKRVVRLTIHAGEDEPVDNIWEAVYELNADRVGHGLTLGDNQDLLARFCDRKISVEMCPSSNFQIAGFADHLLGVTGSSYPLKDYLARGLRVTINTDDPGISRTSFTKEYHKAAAMSGGLSRWQILQLIRNGFRSAFCDYSDRRKHLLDAEEAIVRALSKEGL